MAPEGWNGTCSGAQTLKMTATLHWISSARRVAHGPKKKKALRVKRGGKKSTNSICRRGGIPPCGGRCHRDSQESWICQQRLTGKNTVTWNLRGGALVSFQHQQKVNPFDWTLTLWKCWNNSVSCEGNVTYVIIWSRPRRHSWLWRKSFPESVPCRWWCHFALRFVGRRFWAARLRWLAQPSIGASESAQTRPCSAARPGEPGKKLGRITARLSEMLDSDWSVVTFRSQLFPSTVQQWPPPFSMTLVLEVFL